MRNAMHAIKEAFYYILHLMVTLLDRNGHTAFLKKWIGEPMNSKGEKE